MFLWAKQGWVVEWTQLSSTSGSLTALDALLFILTQIFQLFSFRQRCLGDNKRVPWVGLGSRLRVRATELGARRQGLGARRALPLYLVDILPGVGRVAPLSYSAKRLTLKCFDSLQSTEPCHRVDEAGMGGQMDKAEYYTCSLSARDTLPLIPTRICSSSLSVSAAWGNQTRPLGMPMGHVEDPSYGISGGAAGERGVVGAPSSTHPTIRKGYELQVTFIRRPGGGKPYTSNSFANEDGDLFMAPTTDQCQYVGGTTR